MNILWQPQPGPQTEFAQRPEFEVLYGGAKGGGKSDVLLMEGLRQIANPRYHAGFFRRTYPQLQEMIDRSYQYFLRLGGHWKGDTHRWVFPSGARYDFRHLQNEEDKHNYQGQEFHYLAFDQLEQFTDTQYDFMVMQVRTSDPSIRTYVRGSANPGGVGHAWVKGRWIDGKEPYKTYMREYTLPDGQKIAITSCFIPAKVYDNKILTAANPLYVAQLMSLPEKLRKAMLDGNWDVFEGQYYPEFDREIHVVSPHEIPQWWRRFRSLDYGLDCCACYWWAVAPDERCTIYRELYRPDLSLSQAAEKIVSMTPEDEQIAYTVASPDLWNRRQETGTSGEEIMRRAGLKGLRSASTYVTDTRNFRVTGWRVVREFLQPYEQEGKQVARLAIFSNCVNLIRTLPTLIHDETDPEDVDDACEDHGPESIRYGAISRPRKGVEPAQPLTGTYHVGELRLKGYKDHQIRKMMKEGPIKVIGRL
jgi:hypothetical protein